MKRTNKFRLALAALTLALISSTSPARAHGERDREEHEGNYHQRPLVPPILEPPADQQLTFHAFAVGVQIYVVTQNPTNPALYSWVFKAPEAVLFEEDDQDEPVGLHYAGPTWEHKDGSKVVGSVLQRSPSPNAGAIPWLLLQAVSHEGRGKFSRVTYIQRVNTAGGTAPTTGADAAHVSQEARVPYTAEYYFYRTHHSPADEVTDWNATAENAVKTAALNPGVQGRFMAIVHTAVYDAVNGIVHKYTPYFVTDKAPRGAQPEAAVVQAAYTTLKTLFPAQTATFDAQLVDSLAKIPGNRGDSVSIARGRAWGEHVANKILAWRSADGFSASLPGYLGGGAPGVWRSPPTPTNPDGTLPAVFPQMAVLVPFAMSSPSQFRPGPPPALTSAQYAADVNEVRAIGHLDSAVRTPEQTHLALLWQATGAAEENRVARSVVPPENSLVDNARLFALLNIVACDAIIAGFDSKYAYNFWRPYHAIHLADTDGNPATAADPAWNSLFLSPRHQEYISNHAVFTGAFMHVLARELGNEHTFTLVAVDYPSFTWTFNRFSDATAQVKEARIWAGIHYRNSCNVGEAVGLQIADYVRENFLLPRGERDGEHGDGEHGDHDGGHGEHNGHHGHHGRGHD